MSTKTKVKANEIEWRRNKVIELRARGMNQAAIARELQVSDASISLDMQFLREHSQEAIKQYTTHDLPLQYQITLHALDSIIKRSSDIIEQSDDNREKLQAMQMYRDTHQLKLELLSNATTIDSALNYIRSKQQGQRKSSGGTQLDSTNDDDDSSDSQVTAATTTTTAGKQSVF